MVKVKTFYCFICGSNDDETCCSTVAHLNFPHVKDPKFVAWRDFCESERAGNEKTISSSSKLCCVHFRDDCFFPIKQRHKLKGDAVPSLFRDPPTQKRECHHKGVAVAASMSRIAMPAHTASFYCTLCKKRITGAGRFKFPSNEIVRKSWADFCQIDIMALKPSSSLCQHHFTDTDFCVSNAGMIKLKTGTVPSIRYINHDELDSVPHMNSNNDILRCLLQRNKNCQQVVEHENIPSPSIEDENICAISCNEIGEGTTVVVQSENIIPQKRSRLSNEVRNDELTNPSSLIYEIEDMSDDGENSSTRRCSFCKNVFDELVSFRFPENSKLRSFLATQFGIPSIFLNENHTVCVSHFDHSDFDPCENDEKVLNENAVPWEYIPSLKNIFNVAPVATPLRPVVEADESGGLVKPVRKRKRKAYIGDLSPSDFSTFVLE